MKSEVRFLAHPTKYIETKKESVPRNIQLTVFGYPLRLGVGDMKQGNFGKTLEYISPLTYHSLPSSGLFTAPRADTKTDQLFIGLENPSAQGYSGGPVFDLKYPMVVSTYIQYASGPPSLVGFIHGTVSDNTGGKITFMTPAFYLWDLIKK